VWCVRLHPSFCWFSFCLPNKGWLGWVDLGGLLPRWFGPPEFMVTHPTNDWAWRRATSLIVANMLPLSQTATIFGTYYLAKIGWNQYVMHFYWAEAYLVNQTSNISVVNITHWCTIWTHQNLLETESRAHCFLELTSEWLASSYDYKDCQHVFRIHGLITTRCHASTVYAVVMCLPVFVSQVSVLLKQLNVGSCKQCHSIAQGLWFSGAEGLGKTQTGSPPVEEMQTG